MQATGGFVEKRLVKTGRFTHEAIETQNLIIRVYSGGCCGLRQLLRGVHAIPLAELVSGPVQQEVSIEAHDYRTLGSATPTGERVHVPSGGHRAVAKLSFRCYFQEVFRYVFDFEDARARNLLANNADGTSDPYIVLRFPAGLRHLLAGQHPFGRPRVGHLLEARTARSLHMLNTLYPSWAELGTLEYVGIRSEVESLSLEVEVYDWEQFTPDQLIAKATIPFHGLIDLGEVETPLYLDAETYSELGGQPVRRSAASRSRHLQPAGSFTCSITTKSLPIYEQYSDLQELIPGQQYLAVYVQRCGNITSTDADGYSDTFVSVQWGRSVQQTRVVSQTLTPTFNQVLYFPVRVPEVTAGALQKLGPIILNAFDEDADGNDFIGSTRCTLHQITSSRPPQGPLTISGQAIRSRVLACRQAPLERISGAALTRPATITYMAWFQPDFPMALVVPPPDAVATGKDLGAAWHDRHKAWRARIPEDLRVLPTSYQPLVRDEHRQQRFMAAYLQVMTLPPPFRKELMAFRIAQCLAWESDESLFSGAEDVWTTLKFFLHQVKSGDSEEHALLLCCLLLGLGKRAYTCVGRLRSGDPHTWVMTQEDDGAVVFWETAKGKTYRLPGRWPGSDAMSASTLQQRATVGGGLRAAADPGPTVLVGGSSGSEADDEDAAGDLTADPSLVLRPLIPLPYASIEIVFNMDNLWGNTQLPTPSDISYDLADRDNWLPFIGEGSKRPIVPHDERSTLPRPLALGRVTSMKTLIRNALSASIETERHAKHVKTVLLGEAYSLLLEQGLELLERRCVTAPDESLSAELLAEYTNPTPDPRTGFDLDPVSRAGARVRTMIAPSAGTSGSSLSGFSSGEGGRAGHLSQARGRRGGLGAALVESGVEASLDEIATERLPTTSFEHYERLLRNWRAEITARAPPGTVITLRTYFYAFPDPERIRKELIYSDAHGDNLRLSEDHVTVGVGVYCHPYPARLVATRIALATFVKAGPGHSA